MSYTVKTYKRCDDCGNEHECPNAGQTIVIRPYFPTPNTGSTPPSVPYPYMLGDPPYAYPTGTVRCAVIHAVGDGCNYNCSQYDSALDEALDE